jgi:hypothetical protein
MRKYLLFLMSVTSLAVVIIPSQSVFACTPGEPEAVSIDFSLETTDVIVKATVVEVDDAGINAILEADTYLTGGGPRFLLLSRSNPLLSTVRRDHGYSTGCFTEPFDIPVGLTSYFALKRRASGAYFHTYTGYYYELQQIIPQLGVYTRIDPQAGDDPENLEFVDIRSEEQFIDFIAERSGETPTEPVGNFNDLPRITPLRVITESGANYIYPIDGGEPTLLDSTVPPEWSPVAYPELFNPPPSCASVDCRLDRSDRSVYMTQVDENTIQLNYPYSGFTAVNHVPIEVTGQAFALSANGEAALIWNGDNLSVYAIIADICITCGDGGEIFPNLTLLREFPFTLPDNQDIQSLRGRAVWSADGATLLFGDAQGVWLWDIYRQSEPEVLIPATDAQIPTPLFASATGRYIGYTWDFDARNSWVMIDRFNGMEFENALISPNERQLAQFGVTPDDDNLCQPPVLIKCAHYFNDLPQQFRWIGDETYFIVQCKTNNPQVCDLSGSSETVIRTHGYNPQIRLRILRDRWVGDVAFDPIQNLFAVVVGPQTIRIDTTEYDISERLDSDIVDIQWMDSLFYHEP